MTYGVSSGGGSSARGSILYGVLLHRQSGEDALQAIKRATQRWVSRRIIGRWRDAARQHNILWLRSAALWHISPALRSLWLCLFRVGSITSTPATMFVHRPRSCGHRLGRVASKGHLEDEVSQLPGFALLQEGAQCDSLAKQSRAQ
jgi:hypothetical protein